MTAPKLTSAADAALLTPRRRAARSLDTGALRSQPGFEDSRSRRSDRVVRALEKKMTGNILPFTMHADHTWLECVFFRGVANECAANSLTLRAFGLQKKGPPPFRQRERAPFHSHWSENLSIVATCVCMVQPRPFVGTLAWRRRVDLRYFCHWLLTKRCHLVFMLLALSFGVLIV